MRYKINKPALLSRMGELGQNQIQQICYLRHNISCLMSVENWRLFDCVALGYNIYYMMLQGAFELLRLKFNDYLVIVQSTQYEFIIEIRKHELEKLQ